MNPRLGTETGTWSCTTYWTSLNSSSILLRDSYIKLNDMIEWRRHHFELYLYSTAIIIRYCLLFQKNDDFDQNLVASFIETQFHSNTFLPIYRKRTLTDPTQCPTG